MAEARPIRADAKVHRIDDGRIVETTTLEAMFGLRFGYCPTIDCCAPEVVTPGAAGSLLHAGAWLLVMNTATYVPLAVRNAYHEREWFSIAPRSGPTPVPFEHAIIAGGNGPVLYLESTPQPLDLPTACAGARPTWGLNPRAKHFEVLKTIDELLDSEHTPSAAGLADRLNISVASVNEHIRYLIKVLKIDPPPPPRGNGWQLLALVDYVLSHPYVPPM